MPPVTLSPWQRHVAAWQHCIRCPLCKTRRQVVLAKGPLPCDCLFIGEAPGDSEDVRGKPFIGPAGRDLHLMIEDALAEIGLAPDAFRIAFTNTLACVPKDYESKKKRKGKEPLPNELEACRPRLVSFINMAQPSLIVTVGKVAETEIQKLVDDDVIEPCHLATIVHPAAILQAPVAAKGLMVQRNIVNLVEAFEKLKGSL